MCIQRYPGRRNTPQYTPSHRRDTAFICSKGERREDLGIGIPSVIQCAIQPCGKGREVWVQSLVKDCHTHWLQDRNTSTYTPMVKGERIVIPSHYKTVIHQHNPYGKRERGYRQTQSYQWADKAQSY